MYAIDKIVNAWFLIESLCRLFGVIIRVKIEAAFKRKISEVHVFFHSGFIDVILTSLCYGYGLTTTGLWFRLLRLIAIISALLELFPQLDLLVVGLRVVIFYCFHYFFSKFCLLCSYLYSTKRSLGSRMV